ncbi:hypothetical protein ACHAWF_003446 [Thalassiosira exigua]
MPKRRMRPRPPLLLAWTLASSAGRPSSSLLLPPGRRSPGSSLGREPRPWPGGCRRPRAPGPPRPKHALSRSSGASASSTEAEGEVGGAPRASSFDDEPLPPRIPPLEGDDAEPSTREALRGDEDESRRLLPIPRHVAFVCDGNSRWARARNLPEAAGHAAGAERVAELIERLGEKRGDGEEGEGGGNKGGGGEKGGRTGGGERVECVTLFAFSTENWSRPRLEIDALFGLMEQTTKRYRRRPAVTEGRVRFKVLGDLDDERIPAGARRELRALEAAGEEAAAAGAKKAPRGGAPRGDEALTVCLAINYGGRADLLRAARHLVRSAARGDLVPSDVDESTLSKHLRTSSLPCDPDLIVRTGGERRLSNFFLWEAAYAELYFADITWPDFGEEALDEALRWYGTRKRNFGGR